MSVSFSPNGQILAIARTPRSDCGVLIRHPTLKTLPGHSRWVRAVVFSPDGQILASGSEDHTIRLWEIGQAFAAKPCKGIRVGSPHSALVPMVKACCQWWWDASVVVERAGRNVLKLLQGHSSRGKLLLIRLVKPSRVAVQTVQLDWMSKVAPASKRFRDEPMGSFSQL